MSGVAGVSVLSRTADSYAKGTQTDDVTITAATASQMSPRIAMAVDRRKNSLMDETPMQGVSPRGNSLLDVAFN